jgi:hypothetical protein
MFALISGAQAADCDEITSRHMVGQAMLVAQFVAAAERGGMAPAQINNVLGKIADNSAIEEFWITDSRGYAYLTNTGVDFTFSPDPRKTATSLAFWALIDGRQSVVVQEAQKGDYLVYVPSLIGHKLVHEHQRSDLLRREQGPRALGKPPVAERSCLPSLR